MDPTDLNILHILCLTVSALAILSELTIRARFGAFTTKDLTTTYAALAFYFHLDNYIRLILGICGLHALMPLEIDTLELVELYAYLATGFSAELLPVVIWLSVAMAMSHMLNLMTHAGRTAGQGILLVMLIINLTGIGLFLTGDILLAGLSSIDSWTNVAAFYLQAKTALSYDQALSIRDQFEWHREQTRPFVIRFEDLYMFFFQLLLAFTAWLTASAGLVILIDLARNDTRSLSYTQLMLGHAWLEHLVGHALSILVGLLLPSVRLAARAVAEFTLFG